jgi:uncharacterized protein with PIN domain
MIIADFECRGDSVNRPHVPCAAGNAMEHEQPQPEPIKFLADSMVGKLARWLRILGYDTLYYREIDNNRLLQLARVEGRRLITRDARLIGRRPGLSHTLIRDDRPAQQLRQIVRELHLSPSAGLLTRCVECNEVLEPIDKERARSCVPPYVFRTQERFFRCPICERFYWKGTHEERIRMRLHELFHDQPPEP